MKSRGFTLLEMLIAIAIFSLVTVIALGAIVMLFSSYSKSQSTQVLVDNLNFTLESITRDIRFGKSYSLDDSTSIKVEFEDNTILYELEVDDDGKGRIKRSEFDDNETLISETFATAADIDIETLDIRVEGESTGDGHPRATFLMKGTLIRSNQQSTFALQTTVSQRESEEVVTTLPSGGGGGGEGTGGGGSPTEVPLPDDPVYGPWFVNMDGVGYPPQGYPAEHDDSDGFPEYLYTSVDKQAISDDDTNYARVGGSRAGHKVLFRELPLSASSIVLTVKTRFAYEDCAAPGAPERCYNTSIDPVWYGVFIWNFTTQRWDQIGTNITGNNQANTEILRSSDVNSYINNGDLYVLVNTELYGSYFYLDLQYINLMVN